MGERLEAETSGSEQDCVAYFYRMKWPNGFRCPRCGHSRAYVIQTRRLPLYQCLFCRHQTSLTAGTIMESSHTPLHKWATALQHLSQRDSINAVQLSKLIRVTYKTAWNMLRKVRQAIHDTDVLLPLHGIVRAGVAYYGGANYQPFVRHPSEHPVMVGAGFQMNGNPISCKITVIPNEHLEQKTIKRIGELDYIQKHIQPGTFDVGLVKRRLYDAPLLPELMKQARNWINRAFHGIGRKYLQYYFDEFCFRYNQEFAGTQVLDVLGGICMAPVCSPPASIAA